MCKSHAQLIIAKCYLNDLAYCTRMLGIKMNDLLW